ncbi:hypothetical protein B7463_g1169, partial [Scytalidium lignicola]
MPAPSLIDLSLVDVGDFEYWKLRTILQRIDSAEQLHQIELNSPQIQGDDAELWKALIARDIPNWKEKNYVPKNPRRWYEVYCKYKKEHRREIARDEEVLRNTMLGIKKERETHVSRVVDLRTLPKVPKDPRMLANNGGVPLGKTRGSGRDTPSVLSWNAGSKTKMTDGKSVLTRARREAKEISQRSRMVNKIGAKPGQVLRAPTGMVNNYRKEAEPPLRILTKKRTTDIPHRSTALSASSLEEREQRLRALTNPSGSGARGDQSAVAKPTYVGSSSSEDGDEDSDVDIFGEQIESKSRPPSTSNLTRRSNPDLRSLPPTNSLSSPPSRPQSKPSNLISSIISKPKSAPPASSKSSYSSSTTTEASRIRTSSPAQPMNPKRRAEVDIFNRGAKKPRHP